MKNVMKLGMFVSLILMFAFTVAFAGQKQDSTKIMKKAKPMMMHKKMDNVYKADLMGSNLVPPVKTKAHGEAIFTFSKDGKKVMYKLYGYKIDSVSMAHIHHESKGENGPIAVWLYKGKITGSVNGLIAKGTITNKDMNLDTLKTWIKNGDASVIVHTQKHPNGEIRGLIK